jgi:hypothetical protein
MTLASLKKNYLYSQQLKKGILMMKFLKNLLLIVVIFQSPFVLAKKRGAQATPATKPTTQPTPVQPPVRVAPTPQVPPQPMMPPQSYAQALNIIKTQMTADQVLINNTFNPQFINFVRSLNLSATETQALLQAGMNIHATWTDNNENNRNILSSLRNNIQTITQTQPVPQIQPIQPPRQVSPPQQPIPQPKPIEPPRQIPPPQPIQPPRQVRPPVEQPGQRRQNQPRQQQPARRQRPTQQNQPVARQQPPVFKKMEPVQDMGPAEDRFFMNNLIMLLDPRKAETVPKGAGAMAQEALAALYQKVSPIIMTTNIFEIIMTLRQQIGDQELQRLRTMRGSQLFSYAQQLVQKSHIPGTHDSSIIFLSSIDFNTNNISYYFHTSENLVLLIPKQYIQANIPSALNFDLNDQAKLCGFNPTVLNAVTDLSLNNLMQQIQMQKAKQVTENQFIPHLTSMFTVQKKNDELIHPEQTSKWIIYLAGHGGPAYMLEERKTARGTFTEQLIAQIAGLGTSQFAQLMKFFDEKIDTAYLHYVTCFSGGSNQTFVNETLSSLNVKFIVSSQGIQEGTTSSRWKILPDGQVQGINFIELFKRLKMFFTEKEQQKKLPYVKNQPKKPMKTKKQMIDENPIAKIIQTISYDNNPQNQPFVRFPAAESFVATPLDRTTRVLTETIVRAHEIEQKPFNINADVLIINTPRINVPVNFGRKRGQGHTAIVIPSPEKFLREYEAITYFKEINWQDTVQSLLFNCSYLNARLHPQTFVINTLSGIWLQQSGLPAPTTSSNIKYFIMKILSLPGKGMAAALQPSMVLNTLSAEQIQRGKIGSTINVCFEFNDTIYQGIFAISDTENPTALLHNMERIKFAATPKNSINMNAVASNFLSPQEIARVAKPITLESIAQFINSKIDKQDPSMAIWSGAEIEDLRKFATDRMNK